ncbi:TorD/DmsD family molecular chaperone [Parvibacter caecicola]|uniref:TorA maturation chaperone TorD n=2 Tax=Parvibacter caecicola TaxID=747645 RepID=A0A7W5D0F9_9ACTN|nr:molecular chaperone TorD family protein [Parvibacter caecicola]MBB3170456.1 TorA maturation chaperone TorD [Parvibacter caecicola]MCR2041581.1 molecular chaperone TorD family protein [Parvibacter caecicola]
MTEEITEIVEETEVDEPMDEETKAALISITEQRSATYGLLSRLYRVEVDEEFLKEMKGMRFPAATGNSQVDEGYRLIATFLSNTWGNTITDLAIDYVRTFIGHGVDAFSAAYPYESVYTSEKRLMMQDARDEVLAIYRSQGLDKQETWKEAEDHLALELEFMQILANRTVDALKAGDEDAAIELLTTQKNFLEDHLMAWVPMMTSDMRRFAKTDLYRGLASLTDGFMTVDFEFLQDLLQA